MANLETLELTISANAQGATQGIGQLTRSLSGFQSAVGKAVGGLMRMNEQLTKLKSFGNIKLPNLGKSTGANAVRAGASKAGFNPKGEVLKEFKQYADGGFKSWMYGPRPPINWKNTTGKYGMIPDEEYKKLHPELYVKPGSEQWKQNVANRNEALKNKPSVDSAKSVVQANGEVASSAKAATQATKEATGASTANAAANNGAAQSAKGVAQATNDSTNSLKNNAQAAKEASEEAESGKSAFQRFADAIQRVAKTMMIRMALKALVKNFTEVWQSAYQFSKNMGGDFAKSIDSVRSSLKTMAANIVKAFAPLMSIVAPIFNVIAQGVQYLSMAIQELLKLLGIASELFGATASEIANTNTEASKSKNILAGFDELNVLDSSNGSGSGNSSKITDAFSEQINSVKMIIAESMLAIGLILAFSGHIGIGLALAAVGAATIVGTIVTKWGQLTDETKGQIAEVMIVAGAAMLGIGAIIAMSGANIPLGIALMAVGAANLVTATALSWNLDQQVKDKISDLMAKVGASMLAIGAVLAFSGANIPLGIAMMVAGGLSLVAVVAMNWDSLKDKIVGVFNTIKEKLVYYWNLIKDAVGNAWKAVKDWASAKWSNFKQGWEDIKKKLSDLWGEVQTAVYNAWGVFKNWLQAKWSDLQSSWNNIKTGLKGAWDNVKKAVSDAWDFVAKWLQSTWDNFSSAWNNIGTRLSATWDGIKKYVSDAWDQVKIWINTTWDNFKAGWSEIKGQLSIVWNTVKDRVTGAWNEVKNWLNTTWNNFSSAWNDIGTKLSATWDGIKKYVSNAWDAVKEWAKTTAGSVIANIKKAWGDVKTWFHDAITKPIANFFIDMINTMIDGLNWITRKLNSIGHIKWNQYIPLLGKTLELDVTLFNIPKVEHLARVNAEGEYDIPNGQLFIANEAGPELIGTMDGHSTVANQQQIVEGIRKGVYDANIEQNALLKRQNELLIGILEKDVSINIGASTSFGRVVRRSLDMYNMTTGV